MPGPLVVTRAEFDKLAPEQRLERMLLKQGAIASPEMVDDRKVRFVFSTSSPDRDNDSIDQAGWQLDAYRKNPVILFAHDHKSLPVGKATWVGMHDGKLCGEVEFADHPFAETVYRLVKGGFLNATSVGFRVLAAEPNAMRGGYDFQKQELLETSIVPVPANGEALISAEAVLGDDIKALQDWATKALGMVVKAAEQAAPAQPAKQADPALFVRQADAESVRWNKSVTEPFDISAQEFPARSVEQDLAAKYCGCTISSLRKRDLEVMSVRMGAFLSALDEVIQQDATVDAIRNIDPSGRECPVKYREMQLNSKTSAEFVVDGMRFMQVGGTKMACRVEETWYGCDLVTYAARDSKGSEREFLDKVQQRAAGMRLLKGEAFNLSGEFLQRGSESMDDLFLAEKNQDVAKLLLKMVASRGADMDNRGVLLVGPPGTGKTTFGRVLLNQATEATFVWLAARDFWYGGSRALATAFTLAKENAPAVLFIEDVDNYLTDTTVDFLKTEMDGIKQSKGVLTVLTSNYPEFLPKALIDRPGRFHDVLRFDLPAERERKAMLLKWMPDIAEADLARAVEATHGYSGAHVRDLARFAGILAAEEGLAQSAALSKALEKLAEQRDLITSVQAQGSRYRAPEHVVAKWLLQPLAASQAVAKSFGIKQQAPVPSDVLRDVTSARDMAAMAADTLDQVVRRARAGAKSEEPAEAQPAEAQGGTAETPADPEGHVLQLADEPAAEVVLEIDDTPATAEPVLELADDAATIEDAKDILRGELNALVRQQADDAVRTALNKMRGRVD